MTENDVAAAYEAQDRKARELVRQIQERRDPEGKAMLELVTMYLPYCRVICKPFLRVGIIEEGEVMSLSFLAISAACRKNNEDRGPFVVMVKWLLLRELTMCASASGAAHIPINLSLRLRKYRRERSILGQARGRDPTTAELAASMGTTAEEIVALREIDFIVSPLRLDAPVNNGAGEEISTLGDTVPSLVDVSETAVTGLFAGQLHDALEEVLESLPGNERDVIACRYFENLTLSQTGEKIGISREAARNTEAKAMRRLRKNSGGLEQFLEDRDLYAGTGFYSWQSSGISAPEMAIIKFEERQERTQKG